MQPNIILPSLFRALALVTALAIAPGCQRSVSARMHQPFSLGDLSYSIESAKLESEPTRIGVRRHDRIYLIVAYGLTNNGNTTIDVGLPPFELRTGDGRHFRPDLLVSMLYPAERAERSGSLGAMADALNTQLHPGLSGRYETAFAVEKDVTTQPLYLVASRRWPGSAKITVRLN